ncbi:TonB-dependent receptor, partial [bacterium]
RYSEYDSGSVGTYKALASWAPLDWLRFRGGYQLANRAPNINELFLDASSTAVTLRAADYCQSTTAERTGNNPNNPNRAAAQALCASLIGNATTPFSADPNNFQGGRTDGVMVQISRGNPNLQSEEGKTWTFGTVIRSPFENPLASGITVSADYYRAKITDAIALVTAQTAYDLCFNRDGTSNPTYSIDDQNGACRTIERDAVTGVATRVTSTYTNAGSIETEGLDLTLNWRAGLADMGLDSVPGTVSANLSFNKTFSYKAQEFNGGPKLENAGTLARGGLFDWRTVTTLRYQTGGVGVGLNWRHLPSIRSAQYVTDNATVIQGAKSYDIFGLTGDWDITSNFAISGGVDNVFDKDPNRVGAGQVVNIAAGDGGGTTVLNGSGSTSAAYYDVLGRRYFLNAKLRF